MPLINNMRHTASAFRYDGWLTQRMVWYGKKRQYISSMIPTLYKCLQVFTTLFLVYFLIFCSAFLWAVLFCFLFQFILPVFAGFVLLKCLFGLVLFAVQMPCSKCWLQRCLLFEEWAGQGKAIQSFAVSFVFHLHFCCSVLIYLLFYFHISFSPALKVGKLASTSFVSDSKVSK